MLRRNPEERATLSEILQDSELRKALENPLDGMIIADSGVVCVCVCVCVCSVDNNFNKLKSYIHSLIPKLTSVWG